MLKVSDQFLNAILALHTTDHEEVTYAPVVGSGSQNNTNGIGDNNDDDGDEEFADSRSRRNKKRVAQVSRLSRELTKRKRRQEDWMDDSD